MPNRRTARGYARTWTSAGQFQRPDRLAIYARLIQTIVIAASDPAYPPIAKAAHVQGDVLLRASVTKTGEAEDLKLISGSPMLVSPAMEAARKWKFNQASFLSNGATPIDAVVVVKFNLADSAALARAAQEYREFIASYPAGPATAEAQAKLKQLEQAQADLTMQDAHLDAMRAQYNGAPVRKVGGGVTAPVPIQMSEPEYSKEAKEAKFNGIVLVGLIVDTQGMPQNVHVLRGVGMGLDQNAIDAVKQYRFKPAMEGDKPVPVEVNLEVNFQIF